MSEGRRRRYASSPQQVPTGEQPQEIPVFGCSQRRMDRRATSGPGGETRDVGAGPTPLFRSPLAFSRKSERASPAHGPLHLIKTSSFMVLPACQPPLSRFLRALFPNSQYTNKKLYRKITLKSHISLFIYVFLLILRASLVSKKIYPRMSHRIHRHTIKVLNVVQ